MADAEPATGFAIEPMTLEDADAVLRIYAEGIATGTATFPVTFSDTKGRTYTKKSDDGTTAVYTAPA